MLRHQPIWVQQRLFSVLFSFFAGLAVLLSLVGLASTVSLAIAQRTNEIGIRMALGTQRLHVVRIVIQVTLVIVAGGIIIGLVLNLTLERALRHWMPGTVSALWMLAEVTLMLLICAATACLVPARHAAKVDPMQALRCE